MMFAITERLLLRPGWAEDAAPLRDAIAHEAVAFKLARLPWPYTLADAEMFLGIPRVEGDAEFVITKRTQIRPEVIGGIGLARHDNGEVELGYWITPSEWGQGYVSEAARAVLNIARHSLRIPHLISGHFADNPASGRVLEKLGFRATGAIEDRMCAATGVARPCVLFALDLARKEFAPVAMQTSVSMAA